LRGEKRVENRKWPTSHRGPLLIHAGKSREWLDLDPEGKTDETYGIPLAEMQFGAVVGVVRVRRCIRPRRGVSPLSGEQRWRFDAAILAAWPWLARHEHVEGPYCFILEDAFRFSRPVPFKGRLGLFDVPANLVAAGLSEAMEALSQRAVSGDSLRWGPPRPWKHGAKGR
jgi:activating signal cointegrator 1